MSTDPAAAGLSELDALRQALAESQRAADMMRTVANSVPALMAFYDADTDRCLFANAGYARTFGHDETTILGRTFEEVIGPQASRLVEPHVREVKEHGRTARYERELQTPQGRRWIEVQLVPHHAPSGHLAGSFLSNYRKKISAQEYLAELRQRALEHQSMVSGGFSFTEHEQNISRTIAVSFDRLDRQRVHEGGSARGKH